MWSFFKNFKATKSERKKLRKKRGRWSKSTYLRSQTESKANCASARCVGKKKHGFGFVFVLKVLIILEHDVMD